MISKRGVLPFGISSHGRGLPDVDDHHLVVAKSSGSRIIDESGSVFVDYCMAMGANLIGHAHPSVVKACGDALKDGSMPGFVHRREQKAAEDLSSVGGRLSQVTFTSTGTEAVHLACRVARAHTGRKIIAKAVGGYDGWFEEFRFALVESPESIGANQRPMKDNFTVFRVNESEDLIRLFRDFGHDLAAVIIEPILGNAGCLVPDREFLELLNSSAKKNGTVIISDEIMVGLRMGLKPVSQELGLRPDLMTMGKAIGSGLPVAAVLGTPDVFDVIERGEVVCYGTYQGNPVVTAAVSATLEYLGQKDFDDLFSFGTKLQALIGNCFSRYEIPISFSGIPSMFSLWFSNRPPQNYTEALSMIQHDASRLLYQQLRRKGVITLPSPWGRIFSTFSHNDRDLEISLDAFESAAKLLSESNYFVGSRTR